MKSDFRYLSWVICAGCALLGASGCGNDDGTSGPPEGIYCPADPEEGASTEIGVMWVASEDPRLDNTAVFTDFHVEAPSAVVPSGSSIGLFIRDTLQISIFRCVLVAGNGADGLDGTPGGDEPAPDGAYGNSGEDACSATETKGGTSVASACEHGTSIGGAGGDAGTGFAGGGDGERRTLLRSIGAGGTGGCGGLSGKGGQAGGSSIGLALLSSGIRLTKVNITTGHGGRGGNGGSGQPGGQGGLPGIGGGGVSGIDPINNGCAGGAGGYGGHGGPGGGGRGGHSAAVARTAGNVFRPG